MKIVVAGIDRIEQFLFDFFVGKVGEFRHGGIGIAEVNGPFFYAFNLFRGGQFPHVDVDFGVGLGKGFQKIVHEGDGHVEGNAEAEGALHFLVVSCHFQVQRVFGFADFLGPGEKIRPRICQGQGAASPGGFHQFDPVMGLQGADLGGECGLGQGEFFSSQGQVSGFRHSDEVPVKFKFHNYLQNISLPYQFDKVIVFYFFLC